MEKQLYYNIVKTDRTAYYGFYVYVSSEKDQLVEDCNWQAAKEVLGEEYKPGIWGMDFVNRVKMCERLSALGLQRSNDLRFGRERVA